MSKAVQQAFEITFEAKAEISIVSIYAFDLASAFLEFHVRQQLEQRLKRGDYRIVSVKQSPKPSSWLSVELPANPDIFKCSLSKQVQVRHYKFLKQYGYIFDEEAVA